MYRADQVRSSFDFVSLSCCAECARAAGLPPHRSDSQIPMPKRKKRSKAYAGSTVELNSSLKIDADDESATSGNDRRDFNTESWGHRCRTSTDSQLRRIKCVRVHYRMPVHRNAFVNDMSKSWKLACYGMHPWEPACERRRLCKDAAAAARSETCKIIHHADPDSIFEAQVPLTQAGKLTIRAKEKLAEHDEGWAQLLGVGNKPAPAARKQRKR